MLLTAALMASPSHAIDPVEISYTLSMVSSSFGNATLGRIDSTLTKTDSGYAVMSVTKAQGMAAIIIGSNEQQACEFEINDGRAVPKSYGGGRIGKSDYDVDFDWAERKISFASGESIDMPKGYVVDNCIMPFAAAILKGEGLGEESMYVVDGKKKRIRGYTLSSSSEETLETVLGPKKTIKMVLAREFKPERTFTLWLSKDNQYIPIKMEEQRKSRTTTMMVNSLELI
ncbi:MAG: hypothetical protein ACI9FR_000741 [Cryomorphaceae bacterium]